MTPHINAETGDFAEVILFPGDPLRAKYIAETFLKDANEVCNLRGMLGFTGIYEGERISVMGSGMGIPSASIYAKELITEFGVNNIIRIGSCGAVSLDVHIRDVVIGMGACTDSNVNRIRFKGYDFSAIADFGLVESAVNTARKMSLNVHVGNIFSADLFYTPDTEMFDVMERYKIMGVEMEAAGLYGVAAEFGAKALTICTVTDHIRSGEKLSGDDRQFSLNEGIELALKTALEAQS
ncbi:MAG: purine-nucleoside phosphorylase [Pseudomonadales bacterium]|nr:purine-nucleoside phosphorylase [Pseudomonadales bacterium]